MTIYALRRRDFAVSNKTFRLRYNYRQWSIGCFCLCLRYDGSVTKVRSWFFVFDWAIEIGEGGKKGAEDPDMFVRTKRRKHSKHLEHTCQPVCKSRYTRTEIGMHCSGHSRAVGVVSEHIDAVLKDAVTLTLMIEITLDRFAELHDREMSIMPA